MTSKLAFIAALIFGLATAVSAQERHALIFGVNQYDQSSNSLVNLRSPRQDINLYSNVLEGLGWKVANRRFERQFNVDKTQFIEEIQNLKSKEIYGDDVLLFFAGHGYSDNLGNRIVFAPKVGRARYSTPSEMADGSISIRELVNSLAEGSPNRIILVIDACSDQPLYNTFASDVPDWQNSLARESEFQSFGSEVLILYSSNPGGVAYDSLGELDTGGGAGPDYSVFTRMFAPRLRRGGPLLRAFIDTRIEVEKLTRTGATSQIQRPYILFDSFSGDYSLGGDVKAAPQPTSVQEWRKSPRVCRNDDRLRQEAVAVRDGAGWLNDDERRAGLECIFQAALGFLDVRAVTFDIKTKVRVEEPGSKSRFDNGDDIRSLRIIDQTGNRAESSRIESLDEFEELLAEYAFRPSYQISFLVHRSKSRDQEYVRYAF